VRWRLYAPHLAAGVGLDDCFGIDFMEQADTEQVAYKMLKGRDHAGHTRSWVLSMSQLAAQLVAVGKTCVAFGRCAGGFTGRAGAQLPAAACRGQLPAAHAHLRRRAGTGRLTLRCRLDPAHLHAARMPAVQSVAHFVLDVFVSGGEPQPAVGDGMRVGAIDSGPAFGAAEHVAVAAGPASLAMDVRHLLPPSVAAALLREIPADASAHPMTEHRRIRWTRSFLLCGPWQPPMRGAYCSSRFEQAVSNLAREECEGRFEADAMNAQSSEHPIPGQERSAPRISRALPRALAARPDVKAAMAGVLRERRRRTTRSAMDDAGGKEAVEAKVISLLYGDAGMRHRVFDTQPSHIRPFARKAASRPKAASEQK
jgi:hypothetical protein